MSRRVSLTTASRLAAAMWLVCAACATPPPVITGYAALGFYTTPNDADTSADIQNFVVRIQRSEARTISMRVQATFAKDAHPPAPDVECQITDPQGQNRKSAAGSMLMKPAEGRGVFTASFPPPPGGWRTGRYAAFCTSGESRLSGAFEVYE